MARQQDAPVVDLRRVHEVLAQHDPDHGDLVRQTEEQGPKGAFSQTVMKPLEQGRL